MKAVPFILLSLLCAAGGTVIGHYTQAVPEPNAGDKKPQRAARPGKPSATATEKAFGSERSGPRRAALILEMAARGQSSRLGVLIEACAHDDLALQMLADTWLATDPAAFVRAMAESRLMKGTQRERMAAVLANMMARWGEKDPDAAWQSAESLSGNIRQFNLSQLALSRIERDPQAGLEFVLRNPGTVPFSTNKTLEKRRDLLPLIQQLPDSAAKFHALRNSLKEVPVAEALEAIGHSSEYSSMAARGSVLREAAKKSLEEVVAYHGQATGDNRYAAARAISDALLLKKDPAAAVVWARENLSGSYRTAVIKKAAEMLEKSDPAAAEAARALLPQKYKGTGGK
jgi:hypothetical protein